MRNDPPPPPTSGFLRLEPGSGDAREWPWPVRRLNPRAAMTLALVAAAGVALALGLGAFPRARFGRLVIAQARHLDRQGQTGLATQHLAQYLESNPLDLAALELQASLLEKLATTPDQLEGAIRALDQIVRRDPEGPG